MDDEDHSPELAAEVGEITTWLGRWHAGDRAAIERLVPLVYGELRRQAASYMRRERHAHTLEPTVLVHEVFLRLDGAQVAGITSRQQFYALAATVMRRFLVDAARRRNAEKRGGDAVPITLGSVAEALGSHPGDRLADVLAIDQALARLERVSARRARIVELRFFAGLEVPEIAATLEVSVSTVEREWRAARAFLAASLGAPA
jgi:RNA polymerase sigma factor (TIGR02999 family)